MCNITVKFPVKVQKMAFNQFLTVKTQIVFLNNFLMITVIKKAPNKLLNL